MSLNLIREIQNVFDVKKLLFWELYCYFIEFFL